MLLTSGKGVLTALLILLGLELYLHNEDFLHRYRSVFATGRAADKINYTINRKPQLIFVGNSRVDNAVNPKILIDALRLDSQSAFNLGIPGVNTLVLSGIAGKLVDRQLPGNRPPVIVLLGLDETLFTLADQLNYSVFFADRWQLLLDGNFKLLGSSVLRTWGYSNNLKGLREPGRLRDFFKATLTDQEPWGGPLKNNLGFRAKEGVLSEQEAARIPGENPIPHLDPVTIDYFYRFIASLQKEGVTIAVFYPPLYGRKTAFEQAGNYSEYQKILQFLEKRNVTVIKNKGEVDFKREDFLNAGHLNKYGAEKYTLFLADSIQRLWPGIGKDR